MKPQSKKTTGHIPPWFRLYHEIADDPKLSRLTETKRWRFVVVLVMNHRKQVPCDDKAAAYTMRISEKEARETRKQLTAQGLIRGQWVSPAFLKRQYFVSDHSTDRVRAFRERLKNKVAAIGNGVKHVTVTRSESESESDTERERDKDNGAATPPTLSQVIAKDWKPTSDTAAAVRSSRPDLDLDSEVRKFVAHYTSTEDERANWDAAFTLWIERAKRGAKADGSKSSQVDEYTWRQARTLAESIGFRKEYPSETANGYMTQVKQYELNRPRSAVAAVKTTADKIRVGQS